MAGQKKHLERAKSTNTDPELFRTIWHVFPGFLTLALYKAGSPLWLPFLFLLPGLLFSAFLDGARLLNPELNSLITSRLPAGFIRARERSTMSGTFWYFVGVEAVLGFGTFFYQHDDKVILHIACLSILYLAWTDPAAAFVGRRVKGIRPSWLNGKSLEGSAVAAIVGTLTTAAFLRVGVFSTTAVKGGLIAAMTEAFQFRGWDDNVLIPVLSMILLRLSMSPSELLGA